MIFAYILSAVAGILLLITIAEIIFYIRMKPAPELPDKNDADRYSTTVGGKSFEDAYLFLSGDKNAPRFTQDEIFTIISNQCEYMNQRFDCADFRAQLLFKIYKDCYNQISEECRDKIRKTFLDFRYFMDEPGDDSMCFWSENHQIMFAVSEYLAGQEWQNEIFSNNSMNGTQHMNKASERIQAWMKQRFDYGFSEYLSNNYLAEDISPMANFIAYAEDEELVSRMKIIMDILWLDVALNSTANRFVSVSSRMYGNNKAGNLYGNSIATAMNVLWGNEGAEKILSRPYISEKEKNAIRETLSKKPNHITICFTDIVRKGIYKLPQVIKEIALSDETFTVKSCSGLSPEDMKNENLIGQQPHQIMAQWGAETFTNPEVINNTIEYLKKNRMYRCSFLSYFRFLNLTVFRPLKWDRIAAKYNFMPHGVATGRGNICTYRTAHYSLSTSVADGVDMCGAQEHIWSANIGENLTLFTTHPAGNGNGRYSSSPGYWIGNGRRPMSVQNENVNITIYRLPKKNRPGESGISDITHAYMPECFYDDFESDGNYIFARKNGVFVSLICNGTAEFRPFSQSSANGIYKNRTFPDEYMIKGGFDLCRKGGEYHIYVTELSDADKESFSQFKERIRNNKIVFGDGNVTYNTQQGEIRVSYSGDFTINGENAQTKFDRYTSPFCNVPRKPASIFIDNGKNSLLLDYNKNIRTTNN